MTTKEEDEIDQLISASTHDMLLIFTDKGKVFGTKAWEIPETTRQAKGQAVVNIIDIDQDENVMSVLALNENAKNIVMATKKGIVKKTKVKDYENMRTSGLIAIRLKPDDSLVTVRTTAGNDHILLLSKKGKAIRFPEQNARTMGRATSGVKGINLSPNDELISMEVFASDPKKPSDKRKKYFRDILTISENGLGKRTKVKLFPIQKRAGKGVKAAQINDKTGKLTAARLVTEHDDQVIITSKHGQVIKLPLKNIPQMGRATQGVILMRFAKKGDAVAAMASLNKTK